MILLACPTPQELAAALRHGPWPGVQPLVTGVGPVAAAAATALALGRTAATGVLHLGIAGSFDLQAAPLGSVVAATAETWPEYGIRRSSGGLEPLRFPMLDGLPRPCLPLDPEAAARSLGLALPPAWPRGPALTVAGVSGDESVAAALQAQFQVLTESMEGFAVALAAHLAGVPCLEVRAIANAVGERAKARWDVPGALAALATAAQILLGGAS